MLQVQAHVTMICLCGSGTRSQALVHGRQRAELYLQMSFFVFSSSVCCWMAHLHDFPRDHPLLSYQPTHHSATNLPWLLSHSFFLSLFLLPTSNLPISLFSVHLLMPPLGTCFSQLLGRTSVPDVEQAQPHLQHCVAIHESKHPRLQFDRGAESGPTGGRAGLPSTDALQGDVFTHFHMHRALGEHGHCRRSWGRNDMQSFGLYKSHSPQLNIFLCEN